MKSSQSEKLQDLKSMLVAMKSLGEVATKDLSGIAHVEYSSVLNRLDVRVDQSDLEVGGVFPVHRLMYRGGSVYPWKAECYLGENGSGRDITVSALCEGNDVFRLAIDKSTEISPEAERYLNFLKAEKERERKEREASGVAGN